MSACNHLSIDLHKKKKKKLAHIATEIVLKGKCKCAAESEKRTKKKSEALRTAPKIALLGAGCACLHGDGERSPLGATGVL